MPLVCGWRTARDLAGLLQILHLKLGIGFKQLILHGEFRSSPSEPASEAATKRELRWHCMSGLTAQQPQTRSSEGSSSEPPSGEVLNGWTRGRKCRTIAGGEARRGLDMALGIETAFAY
jgi:hypothetical protein